MISDVVSDEEDGGTSGEDLEDSIVYLIAFFPDVCTSSCYSPFLFKVPFLVGEVLLYYWYFNCDAFNQ